MVTNVKWRDGISRLPTPRGNGEGRLVERMRKGHSWKRRKVHINITATRTSLVLRHTINLQRKRTRPQRIDEGEVAVRQLGEESQKLAQCITTTFINHLEDKIDLFEKHKHLTRLDPRCL